MSIGANIKRLRENNGMNKRELAKAIGVSEAVVGMWENGKRTPLMGNIERMAELFNVLKSEIIDDATGGVKTSFQMLETLSDEKRREAERYIRYLAREDSPGNPK